jgi:hypothetical protein
MIVSELAIMITEQPVYTSQQRMPSTDVDAALVCKNDRDHDCLDMK